MLGVQDPNSEKGRTSGKSHKPETRCNANMNEDISNNKSNIGSNDRIEDDEDNVKIRELQKRLEKRNKLLDIVRKAYHRDVLTIKECILQEQQQEIQHNERAICESNNHIQINEVSITTANDDPTSSRHKITSSSLLSLLSSIPSIDLRRDEGFHLFSPQECELRLHPCFECGGTFEVIHRESSRYKSLLHYRDELLKKIHNLEVELADTKELICNKTEEHDHFKNVTREIDEKYKTKIYNLEQHTIAYDELKLLSIKQKQEIDRLTTVYKEKEIISDELERTKLDLINEKKEHETCQHLLEDSTKKNQLLLLQVEEGLERERNNKKSMKDLDDQNNNHRNNINDLEIELSQMQKESEMCHSQILSLKKNIQQIEDESEATQNELKATIYHRQRSVSELEAMLKNANSKIDQLEEAISMEKLRSEEYRLKMDNELKMQQINEEKRIEEENMVKQGLADRIDFFMTLTSSYIQGLYEQCLAQEELILIEGSSLPVHNKQKIRTQTKKNLILERLENKIDSIHIDWEGILKNDDDRRKVFGNLNNRSQINMSHIDELVKRIHSKNSSETMRIQKGHENELMDTFSRHRNELARLQKQIRFKDSNYNVLDMSLKKQKEQLSNASIDIKKLNETLKEKQRRIDNLDSQILHAKKEESFMQQDLLKVKAQLKRASSDICLKDDEIEDQTETLYELENILKKTTERISEMVEKDRRRLETNVDIGLQAAISVHDFSQQADFLIPRQGKLERHKKVGQEIKASLVKL